MPPPPWAALLRTEERGQTLLPHLRAGERFQVSRWLLSGEEGGLAPLFHPFQVSYDNSNYVQVQISFV